MILLLTCYFVLLLYSLVDGNKFNLLLSQEEVKQLLGLDNELFYVKDGQINQVTRQINLILLMFQSPLWGPKYIAVFTSGAGP
jgi:hypothetical protein